MSDPHPRQDPLEEPPGDPTDEPTDEPNEEPRPARGRKRRRSSEDQEEERDSKRLANLSDHGYLEYLLFLKSVGPEANKFGWPVEALETDEHRELVNERPPEWDRIKRDASEGPSEHAIQVSNSQGDPPPSVPPPPYPPPPGPSSGPMTTAQQVQEQQQRRRLDKSIFGWVPPTGLTRDVSEWILRYVLGREHVEVSLQSIPPLSDFLLCLCVCGFSLTALDIKIEAKLGIIIDNRTQRRLQLPVISETSTCANNH
jgi:hypothetical protein